MGETNSTQGNAPAPGRQPGEIGQGGRATHPEYTTQAATLSSREIELARRVIKALNQGDPPDGTDPASCGPWADTVAALIEAHAQGGPTKVHDVFNALARNDDSLIRLVAGDAPPAKTTWTVAELLQANFPEPTWAVPDLIPTGLVFLAGRPKVGKSWLALQIAGAVGTGGRALDRQVKRGRVLYLALEDSPRRLKQRLEKQMIPASADFTFKTEWTDLPKGGLVELQDTLESDGYTLVVIDTLSRALGRADQQDLAEMTTILGNLQRMAQMHPVAVLLIDHYRKPAGMIANPIDDVLGSTGKTAVADAIMGLVREQGKHQATLEIKGRDLEDRELSLEWDGLTCTWQCLGEAGQVRKDSFKHDVVSAIRELHDMGEAPTGAHIATHLNRNKGQVSRALADLLKGGHIVKGERQGKAQLYQVAPGPKGSSGIS